MSTVVEEISSTSEVATFPEVPKGFELIDGTLVEKIMSVESSWIGGQIFFLLTAHTRTTGTGWAFPPETGCQCFGDSTLILRKPDTLFIKAERMGWDQVSDGWLRIVPDLVVEVISPNDKAYDVDEKIEMFLRAGVPLIWVVNPRVRTIRIIRGNGTTNLLREPDEVSGEDVIPGFRCPVASIFPPRSLSKSTADAPTVAT